MYCINVHFTVYICKACGLWIIIENLKCNSEYAPFCLYTLSSERYLSLSCYSEPHPHAAHRHVPEGCVLVLVNISVELTHRSVQMF